MQLEMFEFTREIVPLNDVLNLKSGDEISMVVGSVNDDQEDIFVENVTFQKVSDFFSDTINADNLRDVYVKICFKNSGNRHELSVPIMIIKKVKKVV